MKKKLYITFIVILLIILAILLIPKKVVVKDYTSDEIVYENRFKWETDNEFKDKVADSEYDAVETEDGYVKEEVKEVTVIDSISNEEYTVKLATALLSEESYAKDKLYKLVKGYVAKASWLSDDTTVRTYSDSTVCSSYNKVTKEFIAVEYSFVDNTILIRR